MNNTDPEQARVVKGRIEKTVLGEVSRYIEEVYDHDSCYLKILLDINRIKLLKVSGMYVVKGSVMYVGCLV